ncbi:MAG: sodium/glutamate symporter [Verrucomicrobiota bacterium]
MEFVNGVLQFDQFMALTLGIVVLFIGKRINGSVRFLREFSIPEPVTGGLIASVLLGILYALTGTVVEFDLWFRDLLLVYFFTTIGINASLRDLVTGGKPLLILVVITVGYMFVQNLTGVGVMTLFGFPAQSGVIAGTVSLIGGHGTAIAWAPKLAEDYGISNAMEMGVACATFGLILASLQGGPVARFLISRHKLTPATTEPIDVGISEEQPQEKIEPYVLLDAILAVHVSMILGYGFNDFVIKGIIGIDLPAFVACLLAGIFLTNIRVPPRFRISGREWPTRTPSIALIADMSLGAFLAMSLMSMQLASIASLAGPVLAVLLAQVFVALAVNLFIVFPAMGRNYDAAVVCAGFGGISLGATPTAMANMSAVTQRYGPSHLAFIVVPLVCAFFIDLANALIIPFFLNAF